MVVPMALAATTVRIEAVLPSGCGVAREIIVWPRGWLGRALAALWHTASPPKPERRRQSSVNLNGPAMPDLHAAIEQLSEPAAALFDEVRAATADVHGVTRDAFGAKETTAGEILIRFCRRHGLEAGFDKV